MKGYDMTTACILYKNRFSLRDNADQNILKFVLRLPHDSTSPQTQFLNIKQQCANGSNGCRVR